MKVTVTLFKPSGKYYTEEDWRFPERSLRDGNILLLLTDVRYSPDFRRINGGAVLVDSQEPWGYPHLFPGTNEEIISGASANDGGMDRYQ